MIKYTDGPSQPRAQLQRHSQGPENAIYHLKDLPHVTRQHLLMHLSNKQTQIKTPRAEAETHLNFLTISSDKSLPSC